MFNYIKINFLKIIIRITIIFLLCFLTNFLFTKYKEYERKKEIAFKYTFAKNDIEEGRYDEAIEELKKILDYKDSKQLLEKAKYNYAIDLYDNKRFEDSRVAFQELGDYEKSLEYLTKIPEDLKTYNFLKDYIGTWGTGSIMHIIDGSLNVSQYIDVDGQYNRLTVLKCSLKNNSLVCPSVSSNPNPTIFNFDNGIVYWYRKLEQSEYSYLYDNIDMNTKLTKISSSVNLPEPLSPTKSPQIGMTKEDVRKSTWGNPKKINKTTTKYGTREQWVYEEYKYLYFDESGTLTSIQE